MKSVRHRSDHMIRSLHSMCIGYLGLDYFRLQFNIGKSEDSSTISIVFTSCFTHVGQGRKILFDRRCRKFDWVSSIIVKYM